MADQVDAGQAVRDQGMRPLAYRPTNNLIRPAASAVDTHELTRRFGPLTAVDRLTLSVSPGAIFGLLGPNGAGKSTAIKMLTTLLEPTSGTARVAGFDVVREAPQVRRSIGYVPQALSADGSLTGYENLLISAKLYGVPRAERRERIRQALVFMGLADAAHKLVRGVFRRDDPAPRDRAVDAAPARRPVSR